MIVYNYKNMLDSEQQELAMIVELHCQVLRDIGASEFGYEDLSTVLLKIHQYKEQEDKYNLMKDEAVEENEVANVRQERLTDIKNKMQLSSVKYDVLSEMNNFLNLLTREFKR